MRNQAGDDFQGYPKGTNFVEWGFYQSVVPAANPEAAMLFELAKRNKQEVIYMLPPRKMAPIELEYKVTPKIQHNPKLKFRVKTVQITVITYEGLE